VTADEARDRRPSGEAVRERVARHRADDPLLPLLEAEQAFAQEPPFVDVGPDLTTDEVRAEVDQVLSEVAELERRYREVAREAEPVVAAEALHRSGMLYEQIATHWPMEPPADAADPQAWQESQARRMTEIHAHAQALMEEAERLREE